MAAPPGPETVSAPQGSIHVCPACGLPLVEETLAAADYRCSGCGLEVAHLQTTALGAPGGLFRWLLNPGDLVLDRYCIEKVLGKGGFAATYLVQDRRVNGKKRALKEIPESLYDATETELLSHLSHPAIPDITDQSREGGMVYLVLELGGGRTLEAERKLAGGKLPYQRVLGWLMQLGPAISYLHAQHPPIIHRDLKPDNILLDDQGRIMLIDFGIAKRAADGGQTRVIARAATHGFSPPEQAMGTGTDPRSDVYALAATAYALITGTIPTPAHERIAGKALVDPLELVPELPPRIAAALLQALTLNVNQRPASVEQFMHALGLAVVPAGDFAATTRTVMVGDAATLAAAAQATSVRIRSERVTVAPSAPVVSRGPRIGSWVAGALILLTLSAGGAWFFLRQPTGPAPAPAVSPSAIAPVQPHGPGQALSTSASPGANSTPRAQVPGTRPSGPLVGGARAQPNLASATPTPDPIQEKQAERPPSGPSATDMLERFRSEQAAARAAAGQPATKTPAAEPPVRVEATVAAPPPPRLTPRPPPRPPPRRSAPAPTKPTGGTSATSWGWKKGGSHQTD